MLAPPLPAPAERSDSIARGASPEPAAPRREDGRFADLLRERRVATAQGTERAGASPDGDAKAGRTTTATSSAMNAATTPRVRPGTAHAARDDEAPRGEPGHPAATEDAQAAAPALPDAGESVAADPVAPAAAGDTGVPIAVPGPIDAPAVRSEAPQSATGHGAGARLPRAAAKAGAADAADAAQGAAHAAGTTHDAAATSAPTQASAAVESSRPAPASRGAEAALPAGAAPAPLRAEIAPPVVTSVALPAPVASPEFGELLGAQVSLFARDGLQQAELRLNPAEMGPIGVQIEIAGNEARINFNADQAPTRDAIERALPELAAALRGEGLTLAGGGVFDRPPGARDSTPTRANPRTRGTGRERVAALPATAPRGFAPQGAVDLYA